VGEVKRFDVWCHEQCPKIIVKPLEQMNFPRPVILYNLQIKRKKWNPAVILQIFTFSKSQHVQWISQDKALVGDHPSFAHWTTSRKEHLERK